MQPPQEPNKLLPFSTKLAELCPRPFGRARRGDYQPKIQLKYTRIWYVRQMEQAANHEEI